MWKDEYRNYEYVICVCVFFILPAVVCSLIEKIIVDVHVWLFIYIHSIPFPLSFFFIHIFIYLQYCRQNYHCKRHRTANSLVGHHFAIVMHSTTTTTKMSCEQKKNKWKDVNRMAMTTSSHFLFFFQEHKRSYIVAENGRRQINNIRSKGADKM